MSDMDRPGGEMGRIVKLGHGSKQNPGAPGKAPGLRKPSVDVDLQLPLVPALFVAAVISVIVMGVIVLIKGPTVNGRNGSQRGYVPWTITGAGRR